MIITGAPLEYVPWEEVDYWDELCAIMDWTSTHVHSTMHVCWGAYAALYYHYGVPKILRDTKLFGVYPHTAIKKAVSPLSGAGRCVLRPPTPGIWRCPRRTF